MITKMTENGALLKGFIIIIIQIALTTMRIIFNQCAFNFRIFIFSHLVLCGSVLVNILCTAGSVEQGLIQNVKSLDEKNQSLKVDKLIKKAIHQVIVGPLSVVFFKQLLKYSTTAAKETGTLDAQPNT